MAAPVGGYDAWIAIKWILIWTTVCSAMCFGPMFFFKSWPDLDDEETTSNEHA